MLQHACFHVRERTLAIDDGEDYIKTNPFPWNKRANVLWLESPAGVGWSVGETKEDLAHNDMT